MQQKTALDHLPQMPKPKNKKVMYEKFQVLTRPNSYPGTNVQMTPKHMTVDKQEQGRCKQTQSQAAVAIQKICTETFAMNAQAEKEACLQELRCAENPYNQCLGTDM